MRVAVVAEYYPRAADPVLGVVGAPPGARGARRRRGRPRARAAPARCPSRAALRRAATRGRCSRRCASRCAPSSTGCASLRPVRRPAAAAQLRLVGRVGGAARCALALRRLRRTFPFDLVHAHYAAPGGRRRAPRRARRARRRLRPRRRRARRRRALARPARRPSAPALAHARLVLANSAGDRGALPRARRRRRRASCTSAPTCRPSPTATATALVTVGHLVARKRHADVLRALWLLRDSHPDLRYDVVGDGPERPGLRAARGRARRSTGASRFHGAARARRRRAPPPARRRVRAAERGRGVRRRLRRGDGGRASRRSAAAASPGPRRSPPRAAGCASSRPPTPRRSPPSCARCSTSRRGGASWARRRARPSRPRSPGSGAGGRPSRPTRRRCGERPAAGPVRHQPRARLPHRAPSPRCTRREDVVFALVGGDLRHGGGARRRAGSVPRAAAAASARSAGSPASGRFRAVVAGLSGRVALPAAYAGARAARVPFVLWATIWRHPRTAAHALSYLPLRALYRARRRDRHLRPARLGLRARPRARAGRCSRRRRASTTRSGRAPAAPRRHAPFQALFAGRLEEEKGVAGAAARLGRRRPAARTRRCCWPATARCAPAPSPPARSRPGPAAPEDLRNFYAGSRRRGRTVGPHARLPGAVGVGGERGLRPGSTRDRHHRGRGRRGRARPPRGDRARRPRRRRARAGRRAAAPARRPRAARAARRRGPRGGRRGPLARGTGRPGWGARWRPPERVAARKGAASVTEIMPRLLLVLLLALLVAAPAASAGTRQDIISDCYDDGKLDGNYTRVADPRRAQQPAGRRRPVLRLPRRARPRARRQRRQGASAAAPAAADGGGGSALGGGGLGDGAAAEPLTASGPEEQQALDAAALSGGDKPIQVGDTHDPPGRGRVRRRRRAQRPAPEPPRGPDPPRRSRPSPPRSRPSAGVSSLAGSPDAAAVRPQRTAPLPAVVAAPIPRRGGGAAIAGGVALVLAGVRVRRGRRPAAGADDVRRGRAHAARRRACARRRCSCRAPARERLHGGLDARRASRCSPPTPRSRSSGRSRRRTPGSRRTGRSPTSRRSRARWRSPGSRPAAGRRCCTGSRSRASSISGWALLTKVFPECAGGGRDLRPAARAVRLLELGRADRRARHRRAAVAGRAAHRAAASSARWRGPASRCSRSR